MSPQKAALTALLEMLEQQLKITVSVDRLPTAGGISAEIQAARNDGCTLDRQRQYRTLPVLFFSKSKNQSDAFECLYAIGNAVSKCVSFPVSDCFQILSAKVSTDVGLMDRIGDYYTYSMIVDVRIAF